jgi:hypothetical protein
MTVASKSAFDLTILPLAVGLNIGLIVGAIGQFQPGFTMGWRHAYTLVFFIALFGISAALYLKGWQRIRRVEDKRAELESRLTAALSAKR